MFKFRVSFVSSRILLCLWFASVLSLLSGALLEKNVSGNASSISPSGCQLINTSLGTKANCTHLGLQFIPQDLPSNTVVLGLSYNQIKTLYNDSFTHLIDIITLQIQKNQLLLIEANTFKHLINMTELSLYGNSLTSLPPGLLILNRHLSILKLSFNKLDSIPRNVFPWSSNITTLDLTGNDISSIKSSDFIPLQNCSSIRLNLNGNALHNLPPNVFSVLTKVKWLSLSNNEIPAFHVSSFSGNNEIGAMILTFCKIQAIIPLNQNQNHFIGSPKIYLINLSHNKLSSLHDFAFWGLNQTNILLLRSNHITTLSNNTFCGLDQLVELDLSHNALISLPLSMFSCNKMLQRVNLAGNKIAHLNTATLSGAPSLYQLDLAYNDIKYVMRNITIPSLEYLDLSFNKFTLYIEKYFIRSFTNLKILNMSHNEIQSYSPYSFTNLKNLKELYLTNELNSMDINEAFRYMDALCVLDVSFAQLVLPSKLQFTNTTSLLKLAMRENSLTSTDLFDSMTSQSLFSGLKSLVRLDLRGNKLNVLEPGTFQPLKRLQKLLLSQSSIRVLSPGVFESLTSLITLDISDNEIAALPADLLQSQSRLSTFSIGKNKLDSIPKTIFSRTPSLHHLYIQQNKLVMIKPRTVFPTNRTIRLDASGNPFSCTCDLSWFVGWLRSGNVELNHPNDTLCSLSSIKDMVHSPILAFHPDQYCGINVLLITGVSLSVVLVAVLSLMAYRKRFWLNYKFFLLKLAILGYEEINQDFDAQDYEYQLNVMYHEDDQGWVDQVMKLILEERFQHLQRVVFGDNGLNLHMFYLDALHYAVENSFKTVLLISNNSVDEAWFMTKVRIALEHVNDTRLDKVILIFLEDIPDENLPYLVRLFLSKNKPYMLWTEDEDGQELFWAQFDKSMRANRVINNVIPV